MEISLYLVRPDLMDATSWGLRETETFQQCRTHQIGNLETQLLVKQSRGKRPRWVTDLSSITADSSLDSFTNMQCGALLLLGNSRYRFIAAFGTGWHYIDLSQIVPDFGLKVVANSVPAEQVISADTRGLDGRGKAQRTAMPAAGPLYELGIETTDALIRQLHGRPDSDFANRATGSASLKLQISNLRVSELERKIDEIYKLYRADTYKRNYPFLDHLRRIETKESELRNSLNQHVNELINRRATDLTFASPDLLETKSTNHYVLRYGRARFELGELTNEQVFEAIRQWPKDDPATSITVESFDDSGILTRPADKLLKYVVTDVLHGGERYVISEGYWYKVAKDYMQDLEQRIDRIPDYTARLNLATWDAQQLKQKGEGQYNRDVSIQRGWALLDKNNFRPSTPRQQVEICDLLTADKELICVKRMTRSSTLSHLFAQGSVSAQLLAANTEGYRDQVVAHLRKLRPGATFGERNEWTVVYALATEKQGPLAKSLFFFSKVNLERTTRHLSALGIKVAIARIPYRAQVKK